MSGFSSHFSNSTKGTSSKWALEIVAMTAAFSNSTAIVEDIDFSYSVFFQLGLGKWFIMYGQVELLHWNPQNAHIYFFNPHIPKV